MGCCRREGPWLQSQVPAANRPFIAHQCVTTNPQRAPHRHGPGHHKQSVCEVHVQGSAEQGAVPHGAHTAGYRSTRIQAQTEGMTDLSVNRSPTEQELLLGTKVCIKQRDLRRKSENSQTISQPALSVELSWLPSLRAILSQVLAKLEDGLQLDGADNPTARCQIRTLSCINMPDKQQTKGNLMNPHYCLLISCTLFIK